MSELALQPVLPFSYTIFAAVAGVAKIRAHTDERPFLGGRLMKVLTADGGIGGRALVLCLHTLGVGLYWGIRFWLCCVRCSAKSRQRQALSTLDDRLLDDIGVSRQQA